MPDALAAVLAAPGLGWLVTAAVLAGVVRGFSGFGTAMVFLPVAARFLSPFEALTVLVVMDLLGPLPNVPRALRDGHPRDILRLIAGLVVALPAGVWLLTLVPGAVFRYGVSAVALMLLALLIAGWRYRGRMSAPLLFGTGTLGGLLAGSVGMAGPPVIMLYMTAPHPAAVIRANTLLYLVLSDVLMLGVLLAFGKLVPAAIGLGLLLAIPYLLGNMAGAVLFKPGGERIYRWVAYGIIAMSAINGLPLLD